MIEPFSLPLSSPLRTAHGPIDTREGFVVRWDRRSETGVGEATPLAGWTESMSDCQRALERALGSSGTSGSGGGGAFNSDGGRDAVFRHLEDAPAARHGYATALLDADARADDVPLYRWLAGDRRCERVPVNATIGDGDVDETVAAAERAVDSGFETLKVKVGARAVETDLERVKRVRSAVDSGVTVRLDANGAWERDQARRAVDGLDSLDVAYVEQPLAADDLAGLAALRDGPVDVAVDETLAARSMADVLAAGAADVVVLKPMVLGGPGTAHTLAVQAREAGVDPVVTTTVDAVVARTTAVHVAAAVPDVRPCGLATADRLAADLAPDPAPVDDGCIAVPQTPGLGIDPAEVSP